MTTQRSSSRSFLGRVAWIAVMVVASAVPASSRAGAQAVIAGVVIADSTRRPLRDVEVVVVGADGADLAVARSDSTGRFRLPLPALTSFRLQARRTGFEILTTASLTADIATAGSIELVLRPARSDLEGLVRGSVTDSTGRPIAFALVRIGASGERVTDDSGRFDIAVRGSARMPIAVRRVGYRPLELTLAGLPDTALTLVLHPLAGTLETVRIEADQTVGSLELRGFYQRLRERTRGANTGHFITPEEIEKRPVSRVSQLVEGLPGVHVRLINPKSYAVFGTNRCPFTIYLDGQRLSSLSGRTATEFDSVISTTAVAGIEVYTRANVPDQYRALNATCGVLLIWTK